MFHATLKEERMWKIRKRPRNVAGETSDGDVCLVKWDKLQEHDWHPLKNLTAITPTFQEVKSDGKSDMVAATKSIETTFVVDDPLNSFLVEMNTTNKAMEALSVKVPALDSMTDVDAQSMASSNGEGTPAAWLAIKKRILQECSMKSVNIASSLFSELNRIDGDDDDEKNDDVNLNAMKSVVLSKTKLRLEQLQAGRQGSNKTNNSSSSNKLIATNAAAMETMTFEKISERIKLLQRDIHSMWKVNQKVVALRTAIKACKLLGDTSLYAFYPAMFVLISQIMDNFGSLVQARIQSVEAQAKKSSASMGSLIPASLDAPISMEARELCRNWFYKSACIRELLPRIYLEMALLPCYRFLIPEEEEIPQIFARLATMTRGIGDPLVAAFARAYLAVVCHGMFFNATQKDPSKITASIVLSLLNDYMFTFRQLHTPQFQASLLEKHSSWDDCLVSHSLAVEMMLSCIEPAHVSQEQFNILWQRYEDDCQNAMVLLHLLRTFPACFYVDRLSKILSCIQMDKSPFLLSSTTSSLSSLASTSTDSNTSMIRLFSCLAFQLSRANSFILEVKPMIEKAGFVELIWEQVKRSRCSFNVYIDCCASLIELLTKQDNKKSRSQVDVILRDILVRLNSLSEELTEAAWLSLESILLSLLMNSKQKDLHDILTSHEFLTLLSLFKDRNYSQLCKDILTRFIEMTSRSTSARHFDDDDDDDDDDNDVVESRPLQEDASLIHTMFEIAKHLHDSIDALISSPQEINSIASLIARFLQCIDYGHHFPQKLALFMDARAQFFQLSAIVKHVVHGIMNIMMQIDARLINQSNMKANASKPMLASTEEVASTKRSLNAKEAAFLQSCLASAYITIPSMSNQKDRLVLFRNLLGVGLIHACHAQIDGIYKSILAALLLLVKEEDGLLPWWVHPRGKQDDLLSFKDSAKNKNKNVNINNKNDINNGSMSSEYCMGFCCDLMSVVMLMPCCTPLSTKDVMNKMDASTKNSNSSMDFIKQGGSFNAMYYWHGLKNTVDKLFACKVKNKQEDERQDGHEQEDDNEQEEDDNEEKRKLQKNQLYIQLIVSLSVVKQPRLPFHIQGVESNDVLYSGDSVAQEAINAFFHQLIDEVLIQVNAWHQVGHVQELQVELVLDFVNAVLVRVLITDETAHMFGKLLLLCQRHLFTVQDGNGHEGSDVQTTLKVKDVRDPIIVQDRLQAYYINTVQFMLRWAQVNLLPTRNNSTDWRHDPKDSSLAYETLLKYTHKAAKW